MTNIGTTYENSYVYCGESDCNKPKKYLDMDNSSGLKESNKDELVECPIYYKHKEYTNFGPDDS